MIRRIISIDKELCNGCGLCVKACHEGAIGIIDGKARLLRDDYCDGLGDCLPQCPTGAISFVEREALPFDKEAVLKNMEQKAMEKKVSDPLPCGCPGTAARAIPHAESPQRDDEGAPVKSRLGQWPVQIKLVSSNAGFFNDASLLIAASCSAFAYGDFHNRFMKNRVTLIGCPKLDGVDYSEKLSEILKQNDIRDITVVRMEVPCCGGLVYAVEKALKQSGKNIPMTVETLSLQGEIK